MDENNQHGYAMTKPLPTCYVKRQKNVLSWKTFDMFLELFDMLLQSYKISELIKSLWVLHQDQPLQTFFDLL